MTVNLEELAIAAREVSDALDRLFDRWEEAEDNSTDGGAAISVALAKQYPFGASLDEVVLNAKDWAEHVEALAKNTTGLPGAVASGDQDAVQADAAVVSRQRRQGRRPA